MTDCDYFVGAEGGLETAVRAAAILGALYDAVYVLEVFPDKAANAWVFGDALLSAVGKEIPPLWTADGYVVDVGNCDVGYFGLQNECDVVMKYGN
jgi:hypothetical protein